MTTTHHTHPDGFARRVLERIEEEKITPRPRWEFLFQNYLFWGLGVVAVLLGAAAFSAMLFEIRNVDWSLALITHSDLLSFFFAAAPFLWVITLGLFLLLGYINVRRTNRGYRYSLVKIAFGAVLTSGFLGSMLYVSGLGSVVEEVIGDLPFHDSIMTEMHSWWLAPESGLLGGKVVSIGPDASMLLRDFHGTLWAIDGSDLRAPDLSVVVRGGNVRLIGVPTDAAMPTFHACFALPFEARGSFVKEVPEPPIAVVASTSERSASAPRSAICKGIRPYQQLHDLNEIGF